MKLERIMRLVGIMGGIVLPVTSIGLTFGMWVYQSTGSIPWGAVTAVGFIAVELVGIGVIYGAFSARLGSVEQSIKEVKKDLQREVENAVLRLLNEMSEKFQTKEACEMMHERRQAKRNNA